MEGDISENGVQLGFIEPRSSSVPPLFSNLDWSTWDGGKVGGKPEWLNKISIPADGTLSCGICGCVLRFLLQIYCPLDDEEAFHRALYIFCCSKGSCISAHSNDKRSIRAFRCQLRRINDFYPPEPASASTKFHERLVCPPLCVVCGFRGSKFCGRCGVAHYCSKEHQVLDFPQHRNICRSGISEGSTESGPIFTASLTTYCFPEYDLCVETEDLDSADDTDAEQLREVTGNSTGVQCLVDGLRNVSLDTSDNEDTDLANSDENSTLSDSDLGIESSDQAYELFLDRIRLGGADQILR